MRSYDILGRLSRVRARDDADVGSVTLRERLEYGDACDPNQPEAERDANRKLNRLGRLHKHYDEAGLLKIEAYDFKGYPYERVRRVIDDAVLLAPFDQPPPDWQIDPYRIEWHPPDGKSLEGYAEELPDQREYRVSSTYDALNRVKETRCPEDVERGRRERRPRYNPSGTLESVQLDDQTYVERVAYSASGQRTLITYGNGVMTRYAYDPESLRLVRLRSEALGATQAAHAEARRGGEPLWRPAPHRPRDVASPLRLRPPGRRRRGGTVRLGEVTGGAVAREGAGRRPVPRLFCGTVQREDRIPFDPHKLKERLQLYQGR